MGLILKTNGNSPKVGTTFVCLEQGARSPWRLHFVRLLVIFVRCFVRCLSYDTLLTRGS
jgi:hypothetical protein